MDYIKNNGTKIECFNKWINNVYFFQVLSHNIIELFTGCTSAGTRTTATIITNPTICR